MNQQDAQFERALNTPPEVTITADFAARVASQMPAPAMVPGLRYRWAQRLAVVCGLLLIAALLLASSQKLATFTLTESIMAMELALITLWLVYRRRAVH